MKWSLLIVSDNDNDALKNVWEVVCTLLSQYHHRHHLLAHDDKLQYVVDRHLKKEAALSQAVNVV